MRIIDFVGVILQSLPPDDEDVMELRDWDGGSKCIHQGKEGNGSRFINHRCKPNAAPIDSCRTAEHSEQRVEIRALVPIEAGGVITIDYGDSYMRGSGIDCRCGSKQCRWSTQARRRRKEKREEKEKTIALQMAALRLQPRHYLRSCRRNAAAAVAGTGELSSDPWYALEATERGNGVVAGI